MIQSREKNLGGLLHVITSFHLKLSRDVLEDNVKIALQNARTAGVAATHVLLEGDSKELHARIDAVLADQLANAISRGAIVVSPIARRPTYFDIFSYANSLDGFVAIANSDVLFPAEAVERIVASQMKPAETCFALTRWNVTPSGIFIQGMTPSPPWPETHAQDLRRHEQNYFSYDAYVFRAPIAIPPDTAGVLIGSLGCDTTLAALFKIAGYAVSNPTLTLRTAHFDVKPRSYRSPSSISDLDRNVDALISALRRVEAGLPDDVKALFDNQDRLMRGRLWFGHPDVGRFGRALQRAIGATPWSHSASPTPLKLRKVKVSRADVDSGLFDIAALVADCEKERLFIEWEVSGFEPGQHIIDVLMNSPRRNAAFPIWQYQWQALRAPEHMTPADERLYDNVMRLVLRTLIAPPATQAAVRPIDEAEAAALGERMAALLIADIEDEPSLGARARTLAPAILMIDPDALNGHGHYLAYDIQLQKAAADAGIETRFLMNARMDPSFLPANMKAYRLLDSHSWEIANRGIETAKTDAFVSALSHAIGEEKKANPDRPLVVYMYCGSFEHARLIQEVMSKFDGVGAMIHLFWLSVDAYKSDAYLDSWTHFATAIAKDPRFRLTVATDGIQALLRKKTGVYFDVAPHPSTTFADGVDVTRWSARKLEGGDVPVVLFPGAVREEKGFLTSIDAVRSLTTTGEPRFHCIVSGRTRADTAPDLVDALNSVRNPLVEIEDRPLNDDQFVEFLARGDILVLPYKASAFADRPSGILIDAVTLGRPLVAIEGTWLGETVRHYGWGEVVPDDGGPSIAAAIRKMRPRYQLYLDAIRTSREGYILQHSWARLLKTILRGVRPGPRQPMTTIRTVSHERSERIGVDETAVVARLLGDRKGRRHLMLDVGAHIGTSAAYFDKLDWTIHCFEPDPANREKLLSRFGDKANIIVDTRALSDRPATGVAFYKSPESTGISALHAFRDTHMEANRVDVTTIADYAQAWGMARVDFLKIDVEGFDLSVLKGVPWDRIKPDVIECEYEDAKTLPLGHSWEDIANFLRELGYAVYISEWHPIVRYGIEHDWRRVVPYPGRSVPTESWGNILAFRTDPGYAAVAEAFNACVHRRTALPQPSPVASTMPVEPLVQPALNAPDDLRRFKNIHAGQRCFVMGNGPSLNKMDLSKLDGEVVFGCNSIFLLFDRIRWRPAYYTCVDSRVLPDRRQEIATMLRDNPGMRGFFPTELQDHITKSVVPTRTVLPPLSNASYFREQWNSKDYPPFSMFSIDINEHIIQPYTVAITMLQIAMYMGFSEIYLVGCDTSYTIPADVKREGLTERGDVGLGLTSTQDNDPNHFDPRYFGKDRKWHDPQVDKMIEHYRYARQVSDLRGGSKIYNATVGGNLEVFERVDYNSLFGSKARAGAGRVQTRAPNSTGDYIRPGSTQKPALAPSLSHDAEPAGRAGPRPLTLFPIGIAQPDLTEPHREDRSASTLPQTSLARASQPVTAAAEAPSPRAEAQLAVRNEVATQGVVQSPPAQAVRRRAGRIVMALAVIAIAVLAVLMIMPPNGDLRPMLLAGAGFLLLGGAGAYFAWRIVGFIRRLSAENAALQQRLLEISDTLAAMQSEGKSDNAPRTRNTGTRR